MFIVNVCVCEYKPCTKNVLSLDQRVIRCAMSDSFKFKRKQRVASRLFVRTRL